MGPPDSGCVPSFAAIDFETADVGRDSACAVGLVLVVGGAITHRLQSLIRPPRRSFTFTHIHGIEWGHVARAPQFGDVWPRLREVLAGVPFVAAHNAAFDRSVLQACCRLAGVRLPSLHFRCTVRLARETWGIYPTTLPDVCRRLGIPLQHHDAGSDAEACARIVLEAARIGTRMGPSASSVARHPRRGAAT